MLPSLRFDDFAAAQAGSADADVLGGGSHLSVNGRRLTFQRRLLTLWAWLMVLPNCGPLPQTSHTRAITLGSFRLIPVRLPKPQFYRNSGDFAKGGKGKSRDRSRALLLRLLSANDAN